MKRKQDWAEKKADYIYINEAGSCDVNAVARALRAAERRGYARAVKMLRAESFVTWTAGEFADWLEEQK